MEAQKIKNVIYEELQIPQEIKLGNMSVSLYDLEKIVDKISSRLEALVGMPSENSFGQWIDIKDKLPDSDTDVIIFDKKRGVHISTFIHAPERGYKKPTFIEIYYGQEISEGFKVIKWMPLPKL